MYAMTDASFNHQKDIGCIGFLTANELTDLNNSIIVLELIDTKINESLYGNTALELFAVIKAVEQMQLNGHNKMIIYTDCMNVCELASRKQQLENSDHKLIHLYSKLLDLMDEYDITFKHIRGHTLNKTKTNLDRAFSRLDKMVRQTVRKTNKQYMQNNQEQSEVD